MQNWHASCDAPNPTELTELWYFYRAKFDDLHSQAALCNVLSSGEFYSLMKDPQTVRITGRVRGAQVAALGVLTPNLYAAPQVSPVFYAGLYPCEHRKGTLFYGVLTAAERGWGPGLARQMAEYVKARQGVLAFDTAKVNQRYADLLGRIGTKLGGDVKEIDTQTFYAAKF